MGLAGFTLADRLGAKSSPCSVPGCARTWLSLASAKGAKLGGRGAANPADPASSMCDPCREAYAKTTDAQRPCDRPGCSGTWTWTVMQQMEAFAGKRQPPPGLCADDERRLGELSDKAIPCAVPGCTRTSVFTRRAQLIAGAPEVEPSLPTQRCGQCEGVFRKLKDRAVRCGINGCDNKWTWPAVEQIEAYAKGLPNDPPRRMCDRCKADFGAIADREVRCRTSGCKKTWTWTRSDQLDACLAGKSTPKAPHRMCESCNAIYRTLQDVERPCRRAGCKGTWIDKRGGQLARAVRGKTGDPYPQYCEDCSKNIVELEDRQLPCKTDNCTGTWTWTKAAQLAAGVRPELKEPDGAPSITSTVDLVAAAAAVAAGVLPEAAVTPSSRKKKRKRAIKPPERRCQDCSDFLKDKKTLEIPCKQCTTPIYWPPESQLQTHLGAWAEPSMCGACKRDAMEAARAVAREALRHAHPGPGESAPPAETPVAAATEPPADSPTPADDSANA
jgi:hypothetical protein